MGGNVKDVYIFYQCIQRGAGFLKYMLKRESRFYIYLGDTCIVFICNSFLNSLTSHSVASFPGQFVPGKTEFFKFCFEYIADSY